MVFENTRGARKRSSSVGPARPRRSFLGFRRSSLEQPSSPAKQQPAKAAEACAGTNVTELHRDLVMLVLQRLDAESLARMECVSKFFNAPVEKADSGLCELAARGNLRRAAGPYMTGRWAEKRQDAKWRLWVESAACGFDRDGYLSKGFEPKIDKQTGALKALKLKAMGPQLLVSDKTSSESRILRWRFKVHGNKAIEFGVVPVANDEHNYALHNQTLSTNDLLRNSVLGFGEVISPEDIDKMPKSVGVRSTATHGSSLTHKVEIQRDSIVEIVALRDKGKRSGQLEVFVISPEHGQEKARKAAKDVEAPPVPALLDPAQEWENCKTKALDGCTTQKLHLEWGDYDVRLAITAWAKTHLNILTEEPSTRIVSMVPELCMPKPLRRSADAR